MSDSTSLIHGYLASKGLPPTAENVMRALQANAQNPGTIQGLANQAPPAQDAGPSMIDQVMQRSAASPATSAQPAIPTPPTPPQGEVSVGMPEITGTTPAPAAAPPPAASEEGISLPTILGVGGGGAAALYALSQLLPKIDPQVAAAAAANPPPNLPPEPQMSLSPKMQGKVDFAERSGTPAVQPSGPTSSLVAGPDPQYVTGVDPMKASMDKAVPEVPPTREPIAEVPSKQQFESMNPRVDDGISVPKPNELGKPTTSMPDIKEIMRMSRTNPEAAGRLLQQLAGVIKHVRVP